MEMNLIAPCGMNCALCISNLAMKQDLNKRGFNRSYCTGCLACGKSCNLKRACGKLRKQQLRFCYECEEFPCQKLKALDKRYSTKYHMSMIENLEYIKEHGTDEFLKKEETKWSCPECGGTICCHNGLCLHCDLDKLIKNKTYRWENE